MKKTPGRTRPARSKGAATVKGLLPVVAWLCLSTGHADDVSPRARDLGIPFDGTPGTYNAITDVQGVTVGHTTIMRDLANGRAARTGVTAVLPRGTESNDTMVFAAWTPLNGNGEMTGTTWIEESGFLEGPVMITNTHSVGAVHEGVIQWRIAAGGADSTGYFWSLPVVAETWDGYLNDINGFHVRAEDAKSALRNAVTGPVAEGSVGGGTGMICYEFKCGIGTSSRLVTIGAEDFTLGVIVQANYGLRYQLTIAGVPVGEQLSENRIYSGVSPPRQALSSIIVIIATDAPLLPHQLKRIARRAALGIAVNGGVGSNSSGDIFVAFSTANEDAAKGVPDAAIRMLPNDRITALFEATIQATEEAIINALVAGRDMSGDEGRTVSSIDHATLQDLLRAHARLAN